MLLALILLLIIPFICFKFKLGKLLLTYLMLIFSAVFMALSFIVSGFITFFFMNDTINKWTMPEFWVTQITNSTWFDTNFWIILFIPLIFVFDIFRVIFHINIYHGNFIIWAFTISSTIFLISCWKVAIIEYIQAQASNPINY